MSSRGLQSAWPRRVWERLKQRPYVLPLVFVGVFLLSMWALNRERPFELDDISPAVLAAIPENICAQGPRFSTLKTTTKRELRLEGIPYEVTIERVEKALGRGIALRRERWFHKNELSPVRETRMFTLCDSMSLDYHERSPMPFFGDLLKELGWYREKIIGLQVRELRDFPTTKGGIFDYTKITSAALNPDTGLKEDVVKPTRCEVVSRINADRFHPKLTGDGYQLNCVSERDVTTTGGIPSKVKTEKIKRVSVFYFIEQLGWQFHVTDQDGELRTDSKLVNFQAE